MREPNVPDVSRAPAESFIWDAKKLPTGLLGPDTAVSAAVEAPNSIRSPVSPASPSCDETYSLPVIGAASGVTKPVSVMSVLPDEGDTTAPPLHSVKSRSGRAPLS